MNAMQEKRLSRLKNYTTRYELTAEHGDGRKVLIGYTSRTSRQGLYSLLRQRLEDGTFSRLFVSNDLAFRPRASQGADLDGWWIRFTGRTQRDCILSEELPFIGDLPTAATTEGGAT